MYLYIKFRSVLNEFIGIITDNGNFIQILSSLTGILAIVFGVVTGLVKALKKSKERRDKYKKLNCYIDEYTKKSLKYYIPTRGQFIDPCNMEEIIDNSVSEYKELIPYLMRDIFGNSEVRFCLILADSGMGKTTFMLKLFFTYLKKIPRKYEIMFIPLYSENAINEINAIINKQNIILLLDGLDESTEARDNCEKYLEKILNVTRNFPKIIITCRTQFFECEDDEPRYASSFSMNTYIKKLKFKKIYLSPFNNHEINIYLNKKYNFLFERNKITRSKKLIEACPKLMVRPMLLSFIDELISDKNKVYNYTYEIYRELVRKWIDRDSLENNNLYKFSEQVVVYMYKNKSVYISTDEIKKLCEEYNIEIKSVEAKSSSLLNRNASGEYKFAHKSILEYFLAEKAFQDVKFREDITNHGFVGYDMVKFFLKEMSLSYVQTSLEEQDLKLSGSFMEYFQLYNVDFPMLYHAFHKKNILDAFKLDDDVYIYIDRANLKGINLRRAKLEGANLEGANLEGANLEGINLIGANLKRARMSGANLKRAKLENVDLEGADLRRTNLVGANIKRIRLKDVNLEGAIIDDYQESVIEEKKYLRGVKIFINKTQEIINYDEYCEKR